MRTIIHDFAVWSSLLLRLQFHKHYPPQNLYYTSGRRMDLEVTKPGLVPPSYQTSDPSLAGCDPVLFYVSLKKKKKNWRGEEGPEWTHALEDELRQPGGNHTPNKLQDTQCPQPGRAAGAATAHVLFLRCDSHLSLTSWSRAEPPNALRKALAWRAMWYGP